VEGKVEDEESFWAGGMATDGAEVVVVGREGSVLMGGCASGDVIDNDWCVDGAGTGGRVVGDAGDVAGVGGEGEVRSTATRVCAGVEVDADKVDEAKVDVCCATSWTCRGSGGGSSGTSDTVKVSHDCCFHDLC